MVGLGLVLPQCYWIVAYAWLGIPDEVVIYYCREAKSITLNVKAVGVVAPIRLTCRIHAQSPNGLSEE